MSCVFYRFPELSDLNQDLYKKVSGKIHGMILFGYEKWWNDDLKDNQVTSPWLTGRSALKIADFIAFEVAIPFPGMRGVQHVNEEFVHILRRKCPLALKKIAKWGQFYGNFLFRSSTMAEVPVLTFSAPFGMAILRGCKDYENSLKKRRMIISIDKVGADAERGEGGCRFCNLNNIKCDCMPEVDS